MKMLSSEPRPGEHQIQLCCSGDNGEHGADKDTSGMTKLTHLCKVVEVNDERLRRSDGEAPLHHHLPSLLQALPLGSAEVRPRPHRDQREEEKH